MKIVAVSSEHFREALNLVGPVPAPRLNLPCECVYIERMNVLLVVDNDLIVSRVEGLFKSLHDTVTKAMAGAQLV